MCTRAENVLGMPSAPVPPLLPLQVKALKGIRIVWTVAPPNNSIFKLSESLRRYL